MSDMAIGNMEFTAAAFRMIGTTGVVLLFLSLPDEEIENRKLL